MPPVDSSAVAYLVHHVALPPKLPQSEDFCATHQKFLLNTIAQALRSFQGSFDATQGVWAAQIRAVAASIDNLSISYNAHGHLVAANIATLFRSLVSSSSTAAVPLEIKAQNAALVVTKDAGGILFEAFELTPSNAIIMSTAGRLVRSIPTFACFVPLKSFTEEGLIDALAETLATMSSELVPEFQPQSRKNGTNWDEYRDAVNPAIVTEYFMNVLGAVGQPTALLDITKRTRDEVLWSSASRPWKRSPSWLLVRVTAQLLFIRFNNGCDSGIGLYKAAMVIVLAKILDLSVQCDNESHIIHAVIAKLTRRLRKLKSRSEPAYQLCVDIACSSLDKGHRMIQARWDEITESTKSNIDLSNLKEVRTAEDVSHHFPLLDDFLNGISSRQSRSNKSHFQDRSTLPYFAATELPSGFNGSGDYMFFSLAAMEQWVDNHLPSWVEDHLGDRTSCEKLFHLMTQYHTAAVGIYCGRKTLPESVSIMYLTIAELWIACDKCACHQYPLLLDYSPEIDFTELQSLSIPSRRLLERLWVAERYIKDRLGRVLVKMPSIFRDFGRRNSFAVRFFDQSGHLQNSLTLIEQQAKSTREQKVQELEDKKNEHSEITAEMHSLTCEYVEVVNYRRNTTKTVHSSNCRKCELKNEAANLTIGVHEWPLSSDVSRAKATVFELQIENSFGYWRDATAFLALDVLRRFYSNERRPMNRFSLGTHAMLSTRCNAPMNQRIGLLSEIKPLAGCHYRVQAGIEFLKVEQVCVDNALRYEYFDNTTGCFTRNWQSSSKVAEMCTYRLPFRSSSLQSYLRTPWTPGVVTPNSVTATLSDCPQHLSLNEYKAFGVLPLGYRIQLLSILDQIAMPTVDFAKVETQCLILQIIHLSGPQSAKPSVERLAHGILLSEPFCHKMLAQLECALSRAQKNWECWRAVATYISLTQRLLSLNNSPEIATRCLDFLDIARNTASNWIELLKERLRTAASSARKEELEFRAAEMALLCICTFNVEERYLKSILMSKESVSALCRGSILVQENKAANRSEHEFIHHAMLQTWRMIMFRALPILQDHLTNDQIQMGLNSAICASWSNFKSSETWDSLEQPQSHWIYVLNGCSIIHFNLLTGELLVNGLPLTRLPKEYTSHAEFSSIFKHSAIDVMPSNEPGMLFSAKNDYFGHTLHFGMSDGDLLLVATKTGKKTDLIPSRVFEKLLPAAFINNYLHWYNHEDQSVEFRPRNSPWKISTENWHLKRVETKWQLLHGSSVLVNLHSQTGLHFSKTFDSLEIPSQIHVSFDYLSKVTSIELPRLQLEFQVGFQDVNIQSRQYRGMIIDSDQRIGTLVGLKNKLVLRPERNLADRMLLVPEGSVSYCKENNHVCVSIDPNTATKVHAYQLDNLLRRIVDNGSLQSKLFLCYLHALTSHCLADPATGHTGTESALNILRSGAVLSVDTLSEDNAALLRLIAGLSPGRSYYPQGKKLMQLVVWDNRLSPLSQHSDFYVEVERIEREIEKYHIFNQHSSPVGNLLKKMESTLLLRDRVRSSTFRVDGFGAEHYTQKLDRVYSLEISGENAERSRRSFSAARMIVRGSQSIYSPITSEKFNALLRYDFLRNSLVQGVGTKLDSTVFAYRASWLENPKSCLPSIWCRIHHSLSTWPKHFNKFSVMMWLSGLAFAKDANESVIQAIASFYNSNSVSNVLPPQTDLGHFNLSRGSDTSYSQIRTLVENFRRSYHGSRESELLKLTDENELQWKSRKRTEFDNNRAEAVQAFSTGVHRQWPIASPTIPNTWNAARYIDTARAMDEIRRSYKIWYENRRFFNYIQELSEFLARLPVSSVGYKALPSMRQNENLPILPDSWNFDQGKIFQVSPPSVSNYLPDLRWPVPPTKINFPTQIRLGDEATSKYRLELLCQHLGTLADSHCENHYVADLRDRCESLSTREGRPSICADQSESMVRNALDTYVRACEEYLHQCNSVLGNVVASFNETASHNGTGPRISPTFWLRQLNNERYSSLPDQWKTIVVEYGLAVTEVHRSRRLSRLAKHPQDLADELCNQGHENWDPAQFPETLLLEAESGIIVRRVQETIAEDMRSPRDNENSVMQLNMGEGKSSVIVPIVAAFLADRTRLARVIVAKPQSKQMLEMLSSKLGGLLGRRIYNLPFSRELKLDKSGADHIGSIYQECMDNRGILLVQPEHILSFKLMGVECLINGKKDVGESLMRSQSFFDNKSRDIVDESDENFSVKFELVYTMGEDRPIEMSPNRWKVIHSVLGLVSRYALQVYEQLPDSLEVDTRWVGRYPRIRILKEIATDMLLDLVTRHICSIGFRYLQVARQPPKAQDLVFRYIRSPDLSKEDIKAVEEGPVWTENTKGTVLLIRGLIAGGILRFTLGAKRWRVNYGLDPKRSPKTKLAVPYRSKDSPSPRSEFSHPDVVIILTTLTYYYGGIDDNDLFDTFAHLLKTDQAENEYSDWVRSSHELPQELHLLSGVNLKDREQCTTELFPLLRYSKAAIDYFLSHLVFNKEMREFPDKLSASGWDLGAKKPNPTTGFSGTNDSRHVLPLDVHHIDLSQQKHTNALVLEFLLQDENTVEILPSRGYTEMSDAEQLLAVVKGMNQETRVILDAGAQILELNNHQVAEVWLRMSNSIEIKAVVFFNDREELLVLHRNGRTELLQTSPFSKDLDGCLVYLDEAHTRGTDLVLPRSYRAAVTLGGNLTKDKLVQACMRMRKLGKGQSVVFCVPEEIQVKIRDRVLKHHTNKITVADVLAWAITETWADLRRSMPLWATQGHRFEKHKNLLQEAGGQGNLSEREARQFLEEEAQTLAHRYRPRIHASVDPSLMDWNTTNENLTKIRERCREFDTMNFDSATLQEEQERELSPEIEEERQIQRPPGMNPMKHSVHPHLLNLIITGNLPEHSAAWLPAFQTLKLTSAAVGFDPAQFPRDLLATTDFMQTVEHTSKPSSESYTSDSYLRPVQCVMSVRVKDKNKRRLLILSPYEADALLSHIRTSQYATIHRYAPRSNLGYSPLDDFKLFNIGSTFSLADISRSLIVQLNIFAGQLYFRSYEEYVELCKFIGLAYTSTEPGYSVDTDGFVSPPVGEWGLKKNPVRFLREIIKTRRNGEDMDNTHLGKVLKGILLTKDDFE